MRQLSHLRRDPLDAPHFSGECLRNPVRLAQPERDLTHDRWGNSELPGDAAIQAVIEGGTAQLLETRGILQGQILSFETRAEYRFADIAVKLKIGEPIPADLPNRIKELRKRLGMTQKELAGFCTVSQVQISNWESGKDSPSPKALVRLGKLAGDPDRAWWWEKAGLKEAEPERPNEPVVRRVPLLKDAAAAGTPRAVDEKEIDRYLSLPEEWIGRRSSITAIRVVGDSMTPIVDEGYIVLVDTSLREPKRLVNQMVAARAEDGVTIKWLRKVKLRGEEMFELVANHTSTRHPTRIIAEGSDSVSIVGKVVKWIGEPPPPRK
jgi:SOS-response transcriptional repressor LexA